MSFIAPLIARSTGPKPKRHCINLQFFFRQKTLTCTSGDYLLQRNMRGSCETNLQVYWRYIRRSRLTLPRAIEQSCTIVLMVPKVQHPLAPATLTPWPCTGLLRVRPHVVLQCLREASFFIAELDAGRSDVGLCVPDLGRSGDRKDLSCMCMCMCVCVCVCVCQ